MASTAHHQGDNRFNAILHQERYKFSDYETKGRQALKRIVELLNQQSDLSIDRYILGGSVGKRTTPGAGFKPDFDGYAFFNLSDRSNAGIQAAIPNLLNRIVQVLRYFGYNATKINEFAVQVQVNEQGTSISIDVVPAVNFGQGDDQWHEVIRRNVAANTNLPYLNSSKAEKTVEFLNKQEEFTHDVAKLAKIWNEKCVNNPNYMAARSTIVELVAVKAALDEIGAMGGNKNKTSALVRFFNYMNTGWSNLRFNFGSVVLPKDAHNKYYSRDQESGILIDPVDPYRNFLDDATVRNGWAFFQNAAKNSLVNWQNLQGGYSAGYADRMIGM